MKQQAQQDGIMSMYTQTDCTSGEDLPMDAQATVVLSKSFHVRPHNRLHEETGLIASSHA